MKSTKINGRVTKDHPMHKLYEAAADIVARTTLAYNNAGVPVPDQFALPIWINADPVMRVTIEMGSKTTADYAIFKAQNEGDEK